MSSTDAMAKDPRAPNPEKPKRPKTDWEAIERDYRAGQLTAREIARQHGVSHTAINKRAKAESWVQDLSKAVRQAAEAGLVSSEVSSGNTREAVQAAAQRVVEVVRSHRKDIKFGRDLTERLLSELDGTTSKVGEIEEIIAKETEPGPRRGAMMRAVSLPSRAGVIKDLSQAMQRLITLERQAFSIDPKGLSGDEVPEARNRAKEVEADLDDIFGANPNGDPVPGETAADAPSGD